MIKISAAKDKNAELLYESHRDGIFGPLLIVPGSSYSQ